jgi:hypothetical protein
MGPVVAARGVAVGGAGGGGGLAGWGRAEDVFTPAGRLAQPPGTLAVDAAFLAAVDAHWAHVAWNLAWGCGDAEAVTPHRAGIALCSCGCGLPWGAASAFPVYEGGGWLRGSDANRYSGSAPHTSRRNFPASTMPRQNHALL